MITREFATEWCNDLKFAWKKCDFQKIRIETDCD